MKAQKEAVLIHGWDPRQYNQALSPGAGPESAWSHRKEFVELMKQRFDVRYFGLPGFDGVPEPDVTRYEVEDFADSFAKWMEESGKEARVIVGYSFGGEIALDYKVRYGVETPVVLISPALARKVTWRSKIAGMSGRFVPSFMETGLKDAYQKMFSRYYREGTAFLKQSYDQVVRRDMTDELLRVDPGGVLLIYGSRDEVTPWSLVQEKAIERGLDYCIIEDGGHNIGQTHPNELVEAIDGFLNQSK